MKKNLKKILLLMMAMLLMLSFVACGGDDDDDDDKEDKKTEADANEDEDKEQNEKLKDSKSVVEAYIKAYEKIDVDGMDKYSVCTTEEMHGDLDEFLAMKEVETYTEDGVSYDIGYKLNIELGDKVSADVDEIKELIEDDEYYEGDIDYDKIEEVCAYEATLTISMVVDNIELDEDELLMTEEEFKEEYGMTYEEYLEENVSQFSEEYDGLFYLAKYDGEWKIIYED